MSPYPFRLPLPWHVNVADHLPFFPPTHVPNRQLAEDTVPGIVLGHKF